jgi:hypothetical protein
VRKYSERGRRIRRTETGGYSSRMLEYFQMKTLIALLLLFNSAAFAKAPKILWDTWYTMTIGKDLHYEYQNDHVEIKDNRIFFQNRVWKKEEGFINEEQLGEYAENNADLSPLFFNFHSTYRGQETKIDGTITGGKTLTVKATRAGQELPLIKKSIPSKVLLSELFPIWLGLHLKEVKVGQSKSFLTVLEDAIDTGFALESGSFRMEKPDDFAKKTDTLKLLVNYRGQETHWWVKLSGEAVRVEVPAEHAVMQAVEKSVAEKFLEN